MGFFLPLYTGWNRVTVYVWCSSCHCKESMHLFWTSQWAWAPINKDILRSLNKQTKHPTQKVKNKVCGSSKHTNKSKHAENNHDETFATSAGICLRASGRTSGHHTATACHQVADTTRAAQHRTADWGRWSACNMTCHLLWRLGAATFTLPGMLRDRSASCTPRRRKPQSGSRITTRWTKSWTHQGEFCGKLANTCTCLPFPFTKVKHDLVPPQLPTLWPKHWLYLQSKARPHET